MPKICLYLQIHQPRRLKALSILDIGKNEGYFETSDEDPNMKIMKKVAEKSYRPMLCLLDSLSERLKGFSYSLSVTGVAIEQMREYTPDVIDLLGKLTRHRNVEFLGETYYHSLASLYSPTEFLSQVKKHSDLVEELFGQKPSVFRNTELIYTNDIAEQVSMMGFKGMLTEGADRILKGRRPTKIYRSPEGTPLLLKHYQLSDDIAFRFSESARNGRPLTAETFCHWINNSFLEDEIVNLFMDFETFGEHQWEDTGIFSFFDKFVSLFTQSGGKFVTVSGAIKDCKSTEIFDSGNPVSWADVDRDITAWRGNNLQSDSLAKVFGLESKVLSSGEDKLIEDWRNLQTSDHFYYMCTKWANDGDVHAYFSPFDSPYNAYLNYSYALADINLRLKSNG